MSRVWAIASRELRYYFVSPAAYVALLFYLLISGIVFALGVYTPRPPAEIGAMAGTMSFLAIWCVPMLTMRSFAEERRSGTIEPLLTNPVNDYEVVVGKWLGVAGVWVVMLLVSLEFPLCLIAFADPNPELGPMLVAYLALFLAGLTYAAVGIAVSATTQSQIAAYLGTVAVLLTLWLIGWVEYAAASAKGALTQVAVYMSIYETFRDVSEGALSSKSVVLFVSVVVFALFIATRVITNLRTK